MFWRGGTNRTGQATSSRSRVTSADRDTSPTGNPRLKKRSLCPPPRVLRLDRNPIKTSGISEVEQRLSLAPLCSLPPQPHPRCCGSPPVSLSPELRGWGGTGPTGRKTLRVFVNQGYFRV